MSLWFYLYVPQKRLVSASLARDVVSGPGAGPTLVAEPAVAAPRMGDGIGFLSFFAEFWGGGWGAEGVGVGWGGWLGWGSRSRPAASFVAGARRSNSLLSFSAFSAQPQIMGSINQGEAGDKGGLQKILRVPHLASFGGELSPGGSIPLPSPREKHLMG